VQVTFVLHIFPTSLQAAASPVYTRSNGFSRDHDVSLPMRCNSPTPQQQKKILLEVEVEGRSGGGRSKSYIGAADFLGAYLGRDNVMKCIGTRRS